MALEYDGVGNWKHSEVCYILVRTSNGNNYIPVKCAKTYNNNYGLDLILLTTDVYSEDGKRKLSSAGSLIEGVTGLKLCDMEKLDDCINSRGLKAVQDTISSMVEKYGWSPRYLRPDEKKTEVFPKEEKDDGDKCILVTPLFYKGMFNHGGKRMRARFVKTVSCDSASYDLYISGSKTPENDYPKSCDDKYYIHVWLNGWLIPLSMTEHYLRKHSVWKPSVIQMYGDEENRDKFFDSLRDGRPYSETEQLVKEQIRKEEELEAELSKDGKYMAEYIKTILDQHVQTYTACKNGTGRFPDFIGAVIVNDLENCIRLSEIKKKQDEEKRKQRIQQTEEKARREAVAKAEKEAAELSAAEKVMLNGGNITDGNIICALADKYNVSIPLRTRGWILKSFAKCEISGSNVSVRYWKTKNGNGSTKIYDIIAEIQTAVRESQKGN